MADLPLCFIKIDMEACRLWWEDTEALDQIALYMPGYEIEMVDSRDLVIHGGGLNCCSWTIRE